MQTEVGVIPNDWKITQLKEVLRRSPKYGINARAIPYDERFATYLRITDITEGGRFAEGSKTSVNHPSADQYLLEQGDLVFARTGASVGKSYLYNTSDGALVYAGFLIRISPDVKKLIPGFLAYYVQTGSYWNWVRMNSMRSGQPGINGQEYSSLPLPLPSSIGEQDDIAEALSDADAYIESLEKLIAKKRLIKQGVMQELLTGKRRLPGFQVKGGVQQTKIGDIPRDWNVIEIDQLATISTGSKNTQDRIDDGTYPFFVRSQTIERINSYSFDGEAVLTAGDGVGTGKVFHYINDKFDVHQRVYRISDFSDSLNGYYFFLYFSSYFYDRIMQMTAKSSVDSVRRDMIAKMLIPVPPNIIEQESIAKVIRDLYDEIETLESKIRKAQQIKQGMMHELLTGRIRLV